MIDKNKFCIAPFVQMVCRADGEAIPCCYYMNPGSDTKGQGVQKEWQNLDKIREVMLDGAQTDKMCQTMCYDREAAGLPSERLSLISIFGLDRNIDHYQQLKDKQWDKLDFPKKVELHTSNLCNLKCLTCHPRDSSAFLTESTQIRSKYKINIQGYGDEDLMQSRYQYTDEQLAKILDEIISHDIEILDLRGGETMMVPYIQKRLLELPLEKREKISIRVQTNGTYLTNEWKEILETFRYSWVQFSIDATDKDIHYIRYPADWDTIRRNLEVVRKISKVNLNVSCVISNLNFPILGKFIQWADDEEYNWGVSTVSTPEIFQPNNLPQAIIDLSADRLSAIKIKHPRSNGSMETLEYLCSLRSLDDPRLWKEFCETISLRDAWRKNSIFDLHPYLREYWVGSTPQPVN